MPERRLGSFRVAARSRFINGAAILGGDFASARETRFGLRAVLGDACGHDAAAVVMAGALCDSFDAAAGRVPELGMLARVLEQSLRPARSDCGFATVVLVELNARELVVASCGHLDPLLIRNGEARELAPPRRSLPLGLGCGPALGRFALRGGDRLLLYSDGASEIRDEKGRYFDLPAASAGALAAGDLDAGLDRLVDAICSHCARLQDDLSLLAVSC